jgi:hypothetical protein
MSSTDPSSPFIAFGVPAAITNQLINHKQNQLGDEGVGAPSSMPLLLSYRAMPVHLYKYKMNQ